MVDHGVALLATAVIVSVVLGFVAFIAIVGVRYAARAPSLRTRRRLATSALLLGVIWLVLVPFALVYGSGFYWIIGVIQGPWLIATGLMQLRELRREMSPDT